MRHSYRQQLDTLHTELIRMGALCEAAIDNAINGLLTGDKELQQTAILLEVEIDLKEREIEAICIRLLLREQPIARDLRQITTAQKMITDLERIGDQAADIAEIAGCLHNTNAKYTVHIAEMAKVARQMLSDGIDAFVHNNQQQAHAVIAADDIVDALFRQIKQELSALIAADSLSGEICLDLLMIAKYLERIGDHAENIAQAVIYSLTTAEDNHDLSRRR